MGYFWKQQDDIPEGMGYPLFGVAHILSVLNTLFLVGTFCVWFLRIDEKKQDKILKCIPIVMIVLELFKDAFLVAVHRFGVGYLPLHICSIGIFVFLLREFLPWKKSKEFFGEIAFILIMPASIMALLFADWTVYYPVWNFINLHSYLWHGLLILYPLLLKLRGDISPSVKHIHWVLIFLIVVVPPIFIFDKKFDVNFFFVNWPAPNSPLSFMEKYMGNPGYLVGYAALSVIVIMMVYAILFTAERVCNRNNNKEIGHVRN